MGITASDKGGVDYDPIKEGQHQAICYGLYDLGTQYNETFGKKQRKVLIQWELPHERIDIEKEGETVNFPRAISKFFTLSLHKKAILRQMLETWRGRAFTDEELQGFDITKLLGANCILQILHDKKGDKTYTNIVSIVPKMKDMPKMEPENTPRYFSFEEHTSLPGGTPEWIEKIVMDAEEWGKGTQTKGKVEPPEEDDSEDIPF